MGEPGFIDRLRLTGYALFPIIRLTVGGWKMAARGYTKAIDMAQERRR